MQCNLQDYEVEHSNFVQYFVCPKSISRGQKSADHGQSCPERMYVHTANEVRNPKATYSNTRIILIKFLMCILWNNTSFV